MDSSLKYAMSGFADLTILDWIVPFPSQLGAVLLHMRPMALVRLKLIVVKKLRRTKQPENDTYAIRENGIY